MVMEEVDPPRLVRGGQARRAHEEVTASTVSIRDPRFTQVVGAGVRFERIATGCLFTEGPLWHPAGQYLLWSDMPGDHLRRWSARGRRHHASASRATSPTASRGTGRAGSWPASTPRARSRAPRPTGASSRSPRTSRASSSTARTTSSARRDGGIYFTDPPYGRAEFYGVPRPQELAFQGVYRVGPDPKQPDAARGRLRPAQRALLLARRPPALRQRHGPPAHPRLRREGRRRGWPAATVWAETRGEGKGAPDGMKLDSQGNVYCCGPGGIHVFAPDAICLGVIHDAGVRGQLRLGRRRPPEPLRHRLHLRVPDPRRHRRAARRSEEVRHAPASQEPDADRRHGSAPCRRAALVIEGETLVHAGRLADRRRAPGADTPRRGPAAAAP